jgi:hypothetical protein
MIEAKQIQTSQRIWGLEISQVAGYRSSGNENGKQETLSEPNLEIDFKEPG